MYIYIYLYIYLYTHLYISDTPWNRKVARNCGREGKQRCDGVRHALEDTTSVYVRTVHTYK